MDVVGEIRSFNRFYTREIGLLDEHLLASDFTLSEARVLYELAQREQTAADIGRALGMEKAHLSRIVGRFRARRLLQSEPDPRHNKRLVLTLTEAGRAAFAALDQGTRSQIEALLRPLGTAERRRLVAAMHDIRSALLTTENATDAVTYRGLEPGDIGWITHRQALLYHSEYGWDWTFEGLVSGILSQFVATFDPSREDAWAAERAGGIVGSIFLVAGTEPAVAKLRLLYVEPSARGLGVGRALVARCVERAREFGYRELLLWTNSVLVAARRIYQEAGFQLVEEAPHHSFGKDLIGQTWRLALFQPGKP